MHGMALGHMLRIVVLGIGRGSPPSDQKQSSDPVVGNPFPKACPSFMQPDTDEASTQVSTTASRAASFKKGIDTDFIRRNRESTITTIRKEKRDSVLKKHRGEIVGTEPPATGIAATIDAGAVSNIPKLVELLDSADHNLQLDGIRGFRTLLSAEAEAVVDEVIEADALPHFVDMLIHDNDEIVFEAAWALTNVASTSRTSDVVECGAVPHLVWLLNSKNADVREQCVWCLGNIAGEATELRDQILAIGSMEPLLCNIAQASGATMLRTATWTLANLCRGKPLPALATLSPAIPVLAYLMKSVDDDVLVEAAWALSYISDGDDDRIQVVIDSGVVPTLVGHLAHDPSPALITPVLRTLGNIVTGDEKQTQTVIDNQGLQIFVLLLNDSRKFVRKEVCWILSNVAAGTSAQIEMLVSVANLIPLVISQLSVGEWEVRKEAAWVVTNIAFGGTAANIRSICEAGAISGLCDLLTSRDTKTAIVALDGLEAILRAGSVEWNEYARMIDECGGVDKIEALQEHDSSELYEKAATLIAKYFGGREFV